MVVLGVWAGAAQADSKSFERAVPAEPRGVVDISNVSGRIEVIGWDRPEVNVRGELAARGTPRGCGAARQGTEGERGRRLGGERRGDDFRSAGRAAPECGER